MCWPIDQKEFYKFGKDDYRWPEQWPAGSFDVERASLSLQSALQLEF